MSEEKESQILASLDKLQKLWSLVYGIVAVIASASAWAINPNFSMTALESQTSKIERIEYTVNEIAHKVGVKVEPPR